MAPQEETETIPQGEQETEEQPDSARAEALAKETKEPEKKPEEKAPEKTGAEANDFTLADLEPPKPEGEAEPEKEPEGKQPVTETEKLQRRLEKVEKGSQKRIDELVADNKAMKDELEKVKVAAVKKPEEGNGAHANPLAKMDDDRLKRLLVAARAGRLNVPDRFKDDPDGYHAEMETAVEDEIHARRDAKGRAGESQEKQLFSAWQDSVQRAAQRFPQMAKDGKPDRESVLWKATETVMTELEKRPGYARHPDLPYLAAQEAYLRLSEGKQRREAAEGRRTKREVRDLRNKTQLEAGTGADEGAEESETDDAAQESVADFIRDTRKRRGF